MSAKMLALAPLLVLFTFQFSAAQSNYHTSPSVITSRRIAPAEAAHRHSSTFYEGALRGEAAWISAYGDYLQDESQAAYTWEHVESLHYENELKKTATALMRKQMLSDYREQERQKRLDRLESAKQLAYEKEMELARKYRLNEFEFNWTTGAIYWPTLVAGPRYEFHRKQVAEIVDRMFRYNDINNQRYQAALADAVSEFRKQLREDAELDHPSTRDDYVAMLGFLQGLKYAPMLMAQANTKDFLAHK